MFKLWFRFCRFLVSIMLKWFVGVVIVLWVCRVCGVVGVGRCWISVVS